MISLADMPIDQCMGFVARLAGLVSRSAFKHKKDWPRAVILLSDRCTVTSRIDHASWLQANDLPELANACRTRRLQPGEILLFVNVEAADVSTGFEVINLAAEVRALLAATGT